MVRSSTLRAEKGFELDSSAKGSDRAEGLRESVEGRVRLDCLDGERAFEPDSSAKGSDLVLGLRESVER
jgi:hypothetical protein